MNLYKNAKENNKNSLFDAIAQALGLLFKAYEDLAANGSGECFTKLLQPLPSHGDEEGCSRRQQLSGNRGRM